jgi:transcriptional regulator GlxA family with amidase domain
MIDLDTLKATTDCHTMVEQDLGNDVAMIVAKKLVLYHRRAGGQSQHSTLLDLSPKSDRIQSAIDKNAEVVLAGHPAS